MGVRNILDIFLEKIYDLFKFYDMVHLYILNVLFIH